MIFVGKKINESYIRIRTLECPSSTFYCVVIFSELGKLAMCRRCSTIKQSKSLPPFVNRTSALMSFSRFSFFVFTSSL